MIIKPDHAGEYYRNVLARFHAYLRPKTYLEIGTENGLTLELSTCATIAVDPRFQLHSGNVIGDKPCCHLFQMTSDQFFADYRPEALFGRPVDLAFLDGLHKCEFLLRDFMNTEKSCRPNSVIVLHDCLPLEEGMTSRVQGENLASTPARQPWWTGDVWRTALALKRYRRDLKITAYDAPLTGLVVVTGLDPGSTVIEENYQEIVKAMMTWNLDLDSYFTEIGIESTLAIDSEENMTRRFSLGSFEQ